VSGLGGPSAILLGERGFVDQELGAMGGDGERLARHRVARDDELPTGPVRSKYLIGRDRIDGLPSLQAAELGSRC